MLLKFLLLLSSKWRPDNANGNKKTAGPTTGTAVIKLLIHHVRFSDFLRTLHYVPFRENTFM